MGRDKGVWAAMHAHFADGPDMESVMTDGTIVRAHACAAGAPQGLAEQQNQVSGRSKGGTTEIHVMAPRAIGRTLSLQAVRQRM